MPPGGVGAYQGRQAARETDAPTDIADSGVDGLTADGAVTDLVPHEVVLYVGTTARAAPAALARSWPGKGHATTSLDITASRGRRGRPRGEGR